MVHEAPCEGNGVAAGATGRSDRATDDGIPCHLAPFDRGFTHRFSPSAHVDAARNPPRPSFRPHRASQAGPCSSTPSSDTRHALSAVRFQRRSEENTSEIQSLMRISYAVFCLKKNNHTIQYNNYHISTSSDSPRQ